jgi:hypothetical protein
VGKNQEEGTRAVFRPSGILAAACVSAATLLASCAPTGVEPDVSRRFEFDYSNARSALEKNDYGAAIRRYEALVDRSGVLEPRIRLELAHALLRADRYDDAARQASAVATSAEGDARAAALAVQGTAQHRMAQVDLTEGRAGPQTATHLRGAIAAFDEVLAQAPDMDPLGALAERRKMAQAALRQLGG